MQLSTKEYEFLGRQVAAGKYIARSTFLLGVIFALFIGAAGGIFWSGNNSKGETRRRLDNSQQGQNQNITNAKMSEAIEHYELESKQKPSDKNVWIQLGNAYYETQNYAKAINAYNTALVIDPKMPEVLVDCGVAYRRTNQPETAIAYFDRALKINPKHEFALFNKGVVLLNDLKTEPEALSLWRELVKNSPQFTIPDGRLLSDVIKAYK